MRAPAVSLLSQLSEGVDATQVFATIDVDDHRRIERRRIGIIPEKKFLTVALEGDFDEVRHWLLLPRAEAEELLAAATDELFRAHLA